MYYTTAVSKITLTKQMCSHLFIVGSVDKMLFEQPTELLWFPHRTEMTPLCMFRVEYKGTIKHIQISFRFQNIVNAAWSYRVHFHSWFLSVLIGNDDPDQWLYIY